ncbi:MAG: hypothetical protein Q7K54_05560 [Candidatus Parcubacteria bacterium]|nr:hypothetical protein [Candidatus Parcubacteria bacterium]
MSDYNLDQKSIFDEFDKEIENYQSDSEDTTRHLEKRKRENPNQPLTGAVLFGVSSTLGVRHDDILRIAGELNIKISENEEQEYQLALSEHKGVSRAGFIGKFKGGLADDKPETIRLHTAHHLLLAALQEVFGKTIKQKGSNINSERLRLDFSFDRKLTDEEKKKIEDIVNEKIKESLQVIKREMPKEEAEKIGAEMEFGVKYGSTVSVYFIEDKNGNIFSKEFCGGPHAASTNELGKFKIIKEEAVSSGVRRIKAILE